MHKLATLADIAKEPFVAPTLMEDIAQQKITGSHWRTYPGQSNQNNNVINLQQNQNTT